MYKKFKFLLGLSLMLVSLIFLLSGSFLGFIMVLASALVVFPPSSDIIRKKIPLFQDKIIRILAAAGFYVIGFFIFFLHIFNTYKSEKPKTEQPEIVNEEAPVPNKEVDNKSEKGVVSYDANGNQIYSGSKEDTKIYKGLKGIMPSDIYPNFKEKGFTIDKKISTDGSFFYCTREYKGIRYDVTIYAEDNINEVTEIRLNAYRNQANLNKTEDMKQFLKYGVSIPYEGADIKKVQDFIDKNYYNHKASITISGVKFTLYCSSEFVRLVTIENK